MRIAVVIPGWEQACCGVAIEHDETTSYQLIALDPCGDIPPISDAARAGSLPRFVVDNHGQAPTEVPQWRVEGVVAAIIGVSYPSVPVAGMPGTLTADTAHPQMRALTAVAASNKDDENSDQDYLVLLDVRADTVLPHYALSAERRSHQQREANTERVRALRANDELGLALQALLRRAHEEHGDRMLLSAAASASSVSMTPHRDGAAALHWVRSADEAADGIRVQLGDGRWDLPADSTGNEIVHELFEAAAAGRVEETVVVLGETTGELVTRALGSDGRSWTATTPYARYGSGGRMVASRELWRRLQRGDHRYSPWI